jgi:hypothetical protein
MPGTSELIAEVPSCGGNRARATSGICNGDWDRLDRSKFGRRRPAEERKDKEFARAVFLEDLYRGDMLRPNRQYKVRGSCNTLMSNETKRAIGVESPSQIVRVNNFDRGAKRNQQYTDRSEDPSVFPRARFGLRLEHSI